MLLIRAMSCKFSKFFGNEQNVKGQPQGFAIFCPIVLSESNQVHQKHADKNKEDLGIVLSKEDHCFSLKASCMMSPASVKPKIAVICDRLPLICALELHHS